ncbi:M91 family zinc metallopeptidase [Acidovorax sp. SUPP2825]|uniref:M91 family zinc metallopeptidase n=1 Tax=Acidovorax sp. SUPP2825 TaxID=2920879 RepID=UPI0023DE525C|nr:M91 family zinc metallopeptidase [Acidovorax sp. SUPP2825]GKS94420.1 type III secretion system effector protein [Acidovorax sp. SUPP2825]
MPIQPSAFPGIFIRTSTRATQDGSGPALQGAEFVRRNESALQQLASRDSGRALLRQIEAITAMAPRKRVVLTPAQNGKVHVRSFRRDDATQERIGLNKLEDIDAYLSERRAPSAFMPVVAAAPLPGLETPGADEAWVYTDPEVAWRYPTPESGEGEPSPADYVATLAHELIHARDSLHGIHPARTADETRYQHPGAKAPIPRSNLPAELRTVGVGAHAGANPSENTIRAEQGLTQRPSYHGFTTDGHGDVAALSVVPGKTQDGSV